MGSGRETETWEVPQTYGKRLSCVASDQVLERKPPLPVHSALLPCSQMEGAISPVLIYPPHGQN